jgi:hypothetical protein
MLTQVRYSGALTPAELEDSLRAKLRDSLQLTKLLPGDTFLGSEASQLRRAQRGADDEAGEALIGVVNLRTLAETVAKGTDADVGELWMRYLQARNPSLLMTLALPKGMRAPAVSDSATSEAQTWLSELAGFMLLQLRQRAGATRARQPRTPWPPTSFLTSPVIHTPPRSSALVSPIVLWQAGRSSPTVCRCVTCSLGRCWGRARMVKSTSRATVSSAAGTLSNASQ